ncbi:SMI1/KNR4 family protein [Amycolatopsis sp. BJA-103]|uniref:SMI1/KNR4 family protein n=1 Tax=Amycolatopsis sp. BJA-103 TaxID=1911175 RepID=UPI000C778129|nr:SMI1/KNR4 family protein [Amycolatopsis sp. BJA-103]AUI60384.1 SMI1/KNR4 family protein [Amycolatopsis sp. BJA-103]PNE16409.1 SMI1/KNR4 family protein [Amycolatopsis sp. BJA-103]
MNSGIDAVWKQITAWLRIHSPITAATLRPPAPAQEIHATQDAVGQPLPDDLLRWWGLMDGVDDEHDYRAAFTVPGVYMPLPVARVRQEWASLSRHPDEDCCRPGGQHLRSAGDTTFGYCTALIPICRGLDGAVLAVDLRTGPQHGTVMNWRADTGAHNTPWANISALLTDTAQRLDHYNTAPETPPQPGEPAIRDDGALIWP